MTEQEAIKELTEYIDCIDLPFGNGIREEAIEYAVTALEEIQQYRAIGTVEEITKINDFFNTQTAKILAKLQEYEKTGLTPQEIMDGKMLTGWIPVDEQLPEENTRILATIKHHKWIADHDSDWVPESEKTVHPEYTEVCEAIYFGDIGWEYRELTGETAFSEDYAFVHPNRNIAEPVVEVLAWMPLPEPYRPETKKTEMEDNHE